MKKVIITGSTGFIGSSLTKRLLKEGILVYGIGRNKKKHADLKKYKNYIPIMIDFSKYYKLPELIDDDIDVFYHFAWDGVFGKSFKDISLQLSNANNTCLALEQAIKIGCKKFIFAGTQNQYEVGDLISGVLKKPRYTNIYSSAKLVAELMCKTLAYNNNIIYNSGLIAMAYGEGNTSDMLPNVIINQLNKGISPNLIEGNCEYDMIYIDDIVSAFIAIGEKGKNQKSYYVGSRVIPNFKDLMNRIGNIINPDIKLNFGTYKDTMQLDYSKIDLDALYNDTGFECNADFEESILKTAKWLNKLR